MEKTDLQLSSWASKDCFRVNKNYWKYWQSESNPCSFSEKNSIKSYQDEWNESDPLFYETIAEAARLARLGDANNLMNEQIATRVAKHIQTMKGEYRNLVDIGSGTGNTVMAILNKLPAGEQQKLHVTLVEPSANVLDIAYERVLKKLSKSQVTVFNKSDRKALKSVGNIDIITAVASLHHNADIQSIFDSVHAALRPGDFENDTIIKGGKVFIGDWHNRFSTHPGEVLFLLEELFELDLMPRSEIDRFIAMFPQVNNYTPSHLVADRQIRNFWIKYVKLLTAQPDDIPRLLPLEGHVPRKMYKNGLKSAGFKNVKQYKVQDDLPVLAVTTATK